MRGPAAAALSALTLGALAGAPGAEPAQFRADALHSGIYHAGGVPVLHGVKWKFGTGGAIVSTPAVSDGTVYFGSGDHRLYALDERSGKPRWTFATHGRIASSPAVAQGRVYFGSFDSNFYALDAASGALLWKFATGGERRFSGRHLHGAEPAAEVMPDPFDVFLSSPAIADGTLFVGSWDSYFYALDAATGRERWRFKTGEDPAINNQVGIQSSAVVADGVVYFGCRDSHLYALDAATGARRWAFSSGDSWVISSPAVRGGRVYFATSDSGLVQALDARTGTAIFSLEFKHWPFFSSPTLAGDFLYIGSHQGKLLAIDLKAGNVAWTFVTDAAQRNGAAWTKADGTPNYQAAVSDSFYDQMVIGLDRLMSVGAVLSTPVIDGDTLFFGSWDGQLYAIG